MKREPPEELRNISVLIGKRELKARVASFSKKVPFLFANTQLAAPSNLHLFLFHAYLVNRGAYEMPDISPV